MKLNKTERELLAEAARSPYHQVGIEHGVQARRPFGVRRQTAAWSLHEKGLLVRTHANGGSPLFKPGWGQNGVVYSGVWKLTEAGEKLLDKGRGPCVNDP